MDPLVYTYTQWSRMKEVGRLEVSVGTVDYFDEFDRKIVIAGGVKIGVFRVGESYFAYENRCLHQGGPACEGRIAGKVEAVLEEDRNVSREDISKTDLHLVCPWHGYEYDIVTGQAAGDKRLRLNRYEVLERDGMIYVAV